MRRVSIQLSENKKVYFYSFLIGYVQDGELNRQITPKRSNYEVFLQWNFKQFSMAVILDNKYIVYTTFLEKIQDIFQIRKWALPKLGVAIGKKFKHSLKSRVMTLSCDIRWKSILATVAATWLITIFRRRGWGFWFFFWVTDLIPLLFCLCLPVNLFEVFVSALEGVFMDSAVGDELTWQRRIQINS